MCSYRAVGSIKKLVGQILSVVWQLKVVGQPMLNFTKTGGAAALPAPLVPPALVQFHPLTQDALFMSGGTRYSKLGFFTNLI